MDTRVKPLDAGASVGPVVGTAAALGDAGRISGSSPDVDAAWAKAIELLGPGTVTRDIVSAIVRAAYGQRL